MNDDDVKKLIDLLTDVVEELGIMRHLMFRQAYGKPFNHSEREVHYGLVVSALLNSREEIDTARDILSGERPAYQGNQTCGAPSVPVVAPVTDP